MRYWYIKALYLIYTFGDKPAYNFSRKGRRYEKRLTDVHLRTRGLCDLLPTVHRIVAPSIAPIYGGKLWLVLVCVFIKS